MNVPSTSEVLHRRYPIACAIQHWWEYLQDLCSLKSGLYIDAFAIAMLVRLLAPLKGYPAMNASEAGMWSATILAFAYTKGSK